MPFGFLLSSRTIEYLGLASDTQNSTSAGCDRQVLRGWHTVCSINYCVAYLRLGIKAAWDDGFRERGFEASFYSLDCFTADLDFPRKGTYVDYRTHLDVRKRRKVGLDTAYPIPLF